MMEIKVPSNDKMLAMKLQNRKDQEKLIGGIIKGVLFNKMGGGKDGKKPKPTQGDISEEYQNRVIPENIDMSDSLGFGF
jgi:hypothetical protein